MSSIDPERVRFIQTRPILQPSRAIDGSASPGRRAMSQHFTRTGKDAGVRPAVSPSHSRRVAVMVRKVPHTENTGTALKAHVRYIERDAGGLDGQDAELFGSNDQQIKGHAFAETCLGDRHHYRITINPEDGLELHDLRGFCRELLAQAQDDLGVRLDWIASAHYDTGRPHLHLVLRGRDQDARAFRIPHDYATQGFRSRAESLATSLLGPRPEQVQEYQIRRDRYTPLDELLCTHLKDGQLDLQSVPSLSRSDALRRLVHLETKGWAVREASQNWRVPDNLKQILYAARIETDRVKAAAQILSASKLKASPADLVGLEADQVRSLVGGYVGCRFSGAFSGGTHVVVVQSEDGRLTHLQMPDRKSVLCLDRVPEGAIVSIRNQARQIRPADRAIAEVARRNGGHWSSELHRSTHPDDNPTYITRLSRRMQALGRAGVCTLLEDGRYIVPDLIAQKGLEHDISRWGPSRLALTVLDVRPLSLQVTAPGVTWLDEKLRRPPDASQSTGFGKEISTALAERAANLRQRGILPENRTKLPDEAFTALVALEVKQLLDRLKEGGKAVHLAKPGDRVAGAYVERVFINGYAFALIEGPGAISAVPWRAGIENARNQQIVGVLKTDGLDFRRVKAQVKERSR